MTYEDYLIEVSISCPPEKRLGEWAYELLAEVRPYLAEKIEGNLILDPRIADSRIPSLYDFLKNNW